MSHIIAPFLPVLQVYGTIKKEGFFASWSDFLRFFLFFFFMVEISQHKFTKSRRRQYDFYSTSLLRYKNNTIVQNILDDGILLSKYNSSTYFEFYCTRYNHKYCFCTGRVYVAFIVQSTTTERGTQKKCTNSGGFELVAYYFFMQSIHERLRLAFVTGSM